MPTYQNKVITADEAATKGLCPECAADLSAINVIAHAEDHWPGQINPGMEYAEARRRKEMLLKLAAPKGGA